MGEARPRYETSNDRSAEEAIINEWCDSLCKGYRWQKMPGGYALIDFAIIDSNGFVRGVVEVKDRPSWIAAYRNIFLNMQKARELYHYYLMGTPALFIVRAEGIIRHVRIDDRLKDWHISWKGRTDRPDWQDLEPCYLVPIEAFKEMP